MPSIAPLPLMSGPSGLIAPKLASGTPATTVVGIGAPVAVGSDSFAGLIPAPVGATPAAAPSVATSQSTTPMIDTLQPATAPTIAQGAAAAAAPSATIATSAKAPTSLSPPSIFTSMTPAADAPDGDLALAVQPPVVPDAAETPLETVTSTMPVAAVVAEATAILAASETVTEPDTVAAPGDGAATGTTTPAAVWPSALQAQAPTQAPIQAKTVTASIVPVATGAVGADGAVPSAPITTLSSASNLAPALAGSAGLRPPQTEMATAEPAQPTSVAQASLSSPQTVLSNSEGPVVSTAVPTPTAAAPLKVATAKAPIVKSAASAGAAASPQGTASTEPTSQAARAVLADENEGDAGTPRLAKTDKRAAADPVATTLTPPGPLASAPVQAVAAALTSATIPASQAAAGDRPVVEGPSAASAGAVPTAMSGEEAASSQASQAKPSGAVNAETPKTLVSAVAPQNTTAIDPPIAAAQPSSATNAALSASPSTAPIAATRLPATPLAPSPSPPSRVASARPVSAAAASSVSAPNTSGSTGARPSPVATDLTGRNLSGEADPVSAVSQPNEPDDAVAAAPAANASSPSTLAASDTPAPPLAPVLPVSTAAVAAPSAATSAPISPAGTVANLAAQIVQQAGGKTSRFDVQMTPEGFGRVDVSVQIDAQGKVTAALSFERPDAAALVKDRAGELQSALAAAGLDLAAGDLKISHTQANAFTALADATTQQLQSAASSQADGGGQAGGQGAPSGRGSQSGQGQPQHFAADGQSFQAGLGQSGQGQSGQGQQGRQPSAFGDMRSFEAAASAADVADLRAAYAANLSARGLDIRI